MKNALIRLLDTFGLVALAGDWRNRCRYGMDFKTQSRNAQFRRRGAPDGLPIPPPHLVYLVTGQFDTEAFYHNGAQGAAGIRGILEKNDLDMEAFRAILDFGCGCGRIMRHWKTLRGPKLYGSDYNPRLISWCRKSLPFAEFNTNVAASRLAYRDSTFDFIYAISVFTHLTEAGQRFWIDELARLLKPGGHLLITVHGTTRLHQLTPAEQEKFAAGQLVVVKERYSGRNICGAFHPEPYVRKRLCPQLVTVDFVPGGARDANQDVFLLRKPMGRTS